MRLFSIYGLFIEETLVRVMAMQLNKNTRERILEVGADIIHQKGFNHTGIQEILSAAHVPKGSFYNYFKSKEDFGLQVIAGFGKYFSSLASEILGDDSLSPLKRIAKLLDTFMDYFKAEGYSRGCPIGNLSQEMADLSPAFRDALNGAIDEMVEGYAKTLAEAQVAGKVSKNFDVRETARFIVSSWHGALIHMKIQKGPCPLLTHKKFVLERLLNSS